MNAVHLVTAAPDRPLRPRPMVGRQHELSEALLAVSRGEECLVITGPPGAGKTLLMAHLGVALADTPGVWVDLRAAHDRASVEVAIGMALANAPLQGEDLVAALSARGPLVLFLDDFERVAFAAPETVATYLEKVPELQIVLTSRERVGAGPCVCVGPLDDDAAAALFHEHAGSTGPLPRNVRDLLRRLDNLPLAVELAAASRPSADAPLDLRAIGADLFSSIERSFSLLTRDEQVTFAECAVFAGVIRPEAAKAVLGAPSHVEALLSKSMLARAHFGSDGVVMLESMRSFVASKPELADHVSAAAIRLRAHLSTLALRVASRADFEPLVALADLSTNERDFVACVERAYDSSDAGDLEAALTVLVALDEPCWQNGSAFASYAAMFDRLLSHARVRDVPSALRARALVARARTRAWRLDEGERALAESTTALELALAAGDARLAALALRFRALIGMFQGRIEAAREDVDRALDLAMTLSVEEGGALRGLCLSLRGLVHRFEGELPKARELLEAARAFHRRHGNVVLGAMVSIDLVYVLVGSGALPEARALLDRVGREEDAVRAVRSPYLALARGAVLLVSGAFEEAASSFVLARSLAERSGETVLGLTARVYAALASFALGRDAEAEMDLMEVAGYLGLGSQPFYAALAWAVASAIQAARGRREEALSLLGRARGRSVAASPFERRCIDLCAAFVESGDLPSELDQSLPEAKILVRVLHERAARDGAEGGARRESERLVCIHPSASWLKPRDGERVDLVKRPVMRRIVAALCDASSRGAWLSFDAVAEAGWPGERMLPSARKNRVHVMVSRLRDIGLARGLEAAAEGYRLASTVSISDDPDAR